MNAPSICSILFAILQSFLYTHFEYIFPHTSSIVMLVQNVFALNGLNRCWPNYLLPLFREKDKIKPPIFDFILCEENPRFLKV